MLRIKLGKLLEIFSRISKSFECIHQEFSRFLSAQHENETAYTIFKQNSERYIVCPDVNLYKNENFIEKEMCLQWINDMQYTTCPSKFCMLFEKISLVSSKLSINLESEDMKPVSDIFPKISPHFNDEQIEVILVSLRLWQKTSSFNRIWKTMEALCNQRISRWNSRKLLLVIDHWYHLQLNHLSSFVSKALHILSSNISTMTITEIVQFMFYINISRKLPHNLNLSDLENKLYCNLSKLTANEIGIVAMSIFKTNTTLCNSLLLISVCERLQTDLVNMEDILLCAVLKMLRSSISPGLSAQLLTFMNFLLPHIKDRSYFVSIHSALCGSRINLFHSGLLQECCEKLMLCISEARIKEMERLAFVLSLFNVTFINANRLFHNFAEEMQKPSRELEAMQYPKSYLSFVTASTVRGIFEEGMIQKVLSEGFQKLLAKEVNYADKEKELVFIDNAVEIECKGYNGPRLKLPYKLNCHGYPESIPLEYYDAYMPFIRYPLKDNCTWFCVLVGNRNLYRKPDKFPLGILAAKTRQLSCLGYVPIQIPWFEYNILPEEKKEVYILKKLGI